MHAAIRLILFYGLPQATYVLAVRFFNIRISREPPYPGTFLQRPGDAFLNVPGTGVPVPY